MRVAKELGTKLSITMSDPQSGRYRGMVLQLFYTSPPDVCDFCNPVTNTALYDTTYKYVLTVQCVVIQMCTDSIGRCNVLW